MGSYEKNKVIETWFELRREMLQAPANAAGLRPPSLRDACYAVALAYRTGVDTTPQTIEAFVNGMEMGAMEALRQAWEKGR